MEAGPLTLSTCSIVGSDRNDEAEKSGGYMPL
jgi:hypothetical protein